MSNPRIGLSLVWAAITMACGGGRPPQDQASITCPVGKALLDGVCVSQTVADYVACVRAQGAQLGAERSNRLSADVGAVGIRAGGAYEVSDALQKRYATSEANVGEIIRNCNQLAGLPKASEAAVGTEPSGTKPGAKPGAAALGCSDGEREGFLPAQNFPQIAACGGMWSKPGVVRPEPACERHAGDDLREPQRDGCSAADLCASGWHVCRDFTDVAVHSPTRGCDGALGARPGDPVFFVTSQSGPGACRCGEGTNDLFGCGNRGLDPRAFCGAGRGVAGAGDGCGNLTFSGDACFALGDVWSCGPDGNLEAAAVVKRKPEGGGVLCCKD